MDDQGNIVETLDFCPRFKRKGRIYRPVAFVRVVRPVAGSPRIRVRLRPITAWGQGQPDVRYGRSEEHTSELQSLMRISYAVFCLKKKKTTYIKRVDYTSS